MCVSIAVSACNFSSSVTAPTMSLRSRSHVPQTSSLRLAILICGTQCNQMLLNAEIFTHRTFCSSQAALYCQCKCNFVVLDGRKSIGILSFPTWVCWVWQSDFFELVHYELHNPIYIIKHERAFRFATFVSVRSRHTTTLIYCLYQCI